MKDYKKDKKIAYIYLTHTIQIAYICAHRQPYKTCDIIRLLIEILGETKYEETKFNISI